MRLRKKRLRLFAVAGFEGAEQPLDLLPRLPVPDARAKRADCGGKIPAARKRLRGIRKKRAAALVRREKLENHRQGRRKKRDLRTRELQRMQKRGKLPRRLPAGRGISAAREKARKEKKRRAAELKRHALPR